jgi:hypothetical protein
MKFGEKILSISSNLPVFQQSTKRETKSVFAMLPSKEKFNGGART